MLDIQLIFLTVVSVFSRDLALAGVVKILSKLEVDNEIIEISKRKGDLYPFPPPGSDKIVENR